MVFGDIFGGGNKPGQKIGGPRQREAVTIQNEINPNAFQTGPTALGQILQGQLINRIGQVGGRAGPTAQGAQIGANNQFGDLAQGLLGQAQGQLTGGQQAQARQSQLDIANRIAGGGTSVSDAQADAARQSLRQQVESQTASARGVNPAIALRQAQNTLATGNQQIQQQASQAALSEELGRQQAAAGLFGQARQGDLAAAGQLGQLGQAAAGLRGQDIGLAQAQAGFDQQTNLANQQAELQFRQLEDQLFTDLLNQGLSFEQAQQQAQLQAGIQLEQLRAQQASNQADLNLGLIGAATGTSTQRRGQDIGLLGGLANSGAGAIATILSDRRAKTDVASADGEFKEFLDALSASKYNYKPEHGGEEAYSVMAQDLEKSAIGKTMVELRPDGLKQVNYAKGLGAMLASQASINKRLSKLEEEE